MDETRIGDWYLCEGYIEEPVRVEAVEPWRIQVRYLTTGRTRWLGYPRIWQACKPHPLPCEVAFDERNRIVTLSLPGAPEPLRLTLGQLRARFLPHVAPAKRSAPRPAPVPAVEERAVRSGWDEDELRWEAGFDDADDDDETDLELDEAY